MSLQKIVKVSSQKDNVKRKHIRAGQEKKNLEGKKIPAKTKTKKKINIHTKITKTDARRKNLKKSRGKVATASDTKRRTGERRQKPN